MPFFPIRNLPTNSQRTLPTLTYTNPDEFVIAGIHTDGQVFIRKSMDAGETWSPEIPVTNATSGQMPAVASIGEGLFIAWAANDGSNRLCYTVSIDGGDTFCKVQPVDGAFTKHAPNMSGGGAVLVSFLDLNGESQMVILPLEIN
ncbi:hypothetical protein [Roseivirga spongicola]|jgi:hypothetical protein|uniref:hypothetical protein n=1 Tax=Roseivirga spongicola TaxID=333140 RepID=UPI002AC99E34|nr:hypothetical protein [Roseivirga spongicola]WPZ10499.1 hypothetical protein T7867_00130 [Roseivirga spongicola]